MTWLAALSRRPHLWMRAALCSVVAFGACAAFAQTGTPVQAIAPQATSPAILGSLILSPVQRRNLESVRGNLRNADLVAPARAKDRLQESSAVPDTLVVSGVVIRSGNRSTVWVNNQPLYGRATDSALRTLAGQAGVLLPGTREMLPKARQGQVVDVPSGQAVDLLPPGSIRIIPPKATPGAATK